MKNLIRNIAFISITILSEACDQKGDLEPAFWEHYPRENIKENYGNDIVVDSKNNKWIATFAGLLKYDNQNWTVYNKASGGPFDTLYNINIDSKDNIYCMASSQKIVRFDSNNWETLSNKDIYNPTSFCVDLNDNLWVAAQYGLYRFDGTKWTSFQSNLTITYSNYWANALIADNSNAIWIACASGGLVKFDGATWTTFTINQEVSNYVFQSLGVDASGSVWAGTLAAGAFKNQGNSFVGLKRDEIPSLCNTINSIGFDKKKNCWFATENGLLKYNGEDWTSFLENEHSIGLAIEAIAIDKTDIIWAVTYNGVYKIFN